MTDGSKTTRTFENSDERLLKRAADVVQERSRLGLEGLTGDLAFVIINTETNRLIPAVMELQRTTNYRVADFFESDVFKTCVLTCPSSADILIRSRLSGTNPFYNYNLYPKANHLPNTRLETLVFECKDMESYFRIQQERGVRFLSHVPEDNGRFLFAQTFPSSFTGSSTGVIEWRMDRGNYRPSGARHILVPMQEESPEYLQQIGTLDHIAMRVKTEHRDDAILEFMGLTDYNFSFAIYVHSLNSITNVSRLPNARFALVFTSGIGTHDNIAAWGPTEKFVANYGPRAHHMAFLTKDIDATDAALRRDGLGFLSELVGSVADGIKQSFSMPSENTLIVNEYIQRFGEFQGFFTEHNVTKLTQATENQ